MCIPPGSIVAACTGTAISGIKQSLHYWAQGESVSAASMRSLLCKHQERAQSGLSPKAWLPVKPIAKTAAQ